METFACSSSSPTEECDLPDAQPTDAQPPPDAGRDVTVVDSGTDATTNDGGGDATTPDAPPDAPTDAPTDAPLDGDAQGDVVTDAGPNCTARLAKMLAAPITPPNSWIGLDLSTGGTPDGGVGVNGLTIDQADILACASSVEATALDGGTPSVPGFRVATFGGAAAPIQVGYNLDSRVIGYVTTSAPSTSTLTFHSRAGGKYGSADGGTNVYVISLGANADGGAGSVTKNGQDFSADWKFVSDGGPSHASAWVNELYDGIMATFAPSVAAVDDCVNAPFHRNNGIEVESSCLTFGENGIPTILGVRPLGLYITFAQGTNQAQDMYEFYPGGYPSCATPNASTEALTYSWMGTTGNHRPSLGPTWDGVTIGGLSASEPIANGAGLLATEANLIAGCNGVSVPAPDPGYGAEAWGPNGEVELEYNRDSGVAYKLFAKQGYKGQLDFSTYLDDGGGNEYVIAPGTLTKNGAPVTLDWSGSGGTLTSVITDISNAWLNDYCGVVDDDCAAAGNCTIQPNDGQGHSSFTLALSPTLHGACRDFHPITFVFPMGTSVPSEIYATNPAGK